MRIPMAGKRFSDRAKEKRSSRDADLMALKEGRISLSDLAHKNDFFANLNIEKFVLVAIGRKRLRSR